jgi:hypothetical protein
MCQRRIHCFGWTHLKPRPSYNTLSKLPTSHIAVDVECASCMSHVVRFTLRVLLVFYMLLSSSKIKALKFYKKDTENPSIFISIPVVVVYAYGANARNMRYYVCTPCTTQYETALDKQSLTRSSGEQPPKT